MGFVRINDNNQFIRQLNSAHNVKQQRHGRSLSTMSFDHSTPPITNNNPTPPPSWSRRRFFSLPFLLTTSLQTTPSHATGLVKFPCLTPLQNTYHFSRAGQSLREADNIISTNPLFGTNREQALSSKGIEQMEEVCELIKKDGRLPTVVRYSLQANAIDGADIIGKNLNIGRDRLVPEFNFMDPRAIGSWDMTPLSQTTPALWALDAYESDKYGQGGRPPPNEDGTPNETLADQAVRLRQLLSVLETQYSGDTILLVFPDGTGPALLECLMAGVPLNRVHELEYMPGDVRFNVTRDETLSRRATETDETYKATLERGRQELQTLRSSPEQIVNVNDLREEEELRQWEETKKINEVMKREEEERVNKKREERRREVERGLEERKNYVSVSGNGAAAADNGGLMAVAGSIVVVGGVGVAFSMNRDEETTDIVSTTAETEAKINNATNNDIKDPSKITHDEVIISSTNNDDTYNELPSSVINERQNETKKEDDKPTIKDAKSMMKEYLDEDDGGDAWLDMMTQLANEADE